MNSYRNIVRGVWLLLCLGIAIAVGCNEPSDDLGTPFFPDLDIDMDGDSDGDNDSDSDNDSYADSDSDSDVDSDSDTDADSDSDSDSGVDSGIDIDAGLVDAGPCEGNCSARFFTLCTCGADDPCGWVENDRCDVDDCSGLGGGIFDDSADCDYGDCGGTCGPGHYNTCTCNPADPCGRAENNTCDMACVDDDIVDNMYDDSVDCAGPCGGQCGNEFGVGIVYSQCTCTADADAGLDPCGWIGDGICHAGPGLCEGVVSSTFPDKVDCQ